MAENVVTDDNKWTVTDHSLFTTVTNPAMVTTAWIHCNVMLADSDITPAIVAVIIVGIVTSVIQWTVAADVATRTCTEKWAICVGARRSIQTLRGIHHTLINIFIAVSACKACVTAT